MILKIFGSILFLYLLWRNLKDNYKSDELISYGWIGLILFFVGGRVGWVLENLNIWQDNVWQSLFFWQNPGINYIGSIAGWVLAAFLVSKKFSWKLYPLLEDSIVNLGILMLFFNLGDLAIAGGHMIVVERLVVNIVVLVATIWMIGKYRSFVWYRSGKKGFAFLFANIVTSILFLTGSIIFGRIEIELVFWVIWGLISLVGLFILGEVIEPAKWSLFKRNK